MTIELTKPSLATSYAKGPASGARTMLHIGIDIDPARARRWQVTLVERLRRAGHMVAIRRIRRAPPPPVALDLIVTLERLVHGRSGPHPGARLSVAEIAGLEGPVGSPQLDLVIDLTGGEPDAPGPRRLQPIYRGGLLEEDAASALLCGQMPSLGLRDSAAAERPSILRIAVEDPLLLTSALDQLFSRLLTLVLSAVERIARGEVIEGHAPAVVVRSSGWTLLRSGLALAQEFSAALTRLAKTEPHWYIGYRSADANRLTETLTLPADGYTRVSDDGRRFYADPLIVAHGGRRLIFVEEFQYGADKGVLSVIEVTADGSLAPARPIIEEPHHLSYPFVFEEDGEMWLIPESSNVRRIDLYRAVAFPDRWEFAATLIDGVDASDATLLRHGGRLWLFATVGELGSSTWDTLCIWSAERLLGPWVAHPDNPVLVDALGVRPGGAFFERGGELWRPAQDCTTGYGAGLVLARVDELSEERFRQTIQTVIHPGGAWPGISFHTVNWAGGIEVVDGCEARR